MANMSDVVLVWQQGGAQIYKPTSEDSSALEAMHELLTSHMLVLSESSFSIVPAMLGNMTTLAPLCSSRPALPHWTLLPCGHRPGKLTGTRLQGSIAKIIEPLPWPPPQLARDWLKPL